jgi:hypothetical protein
VILQNEKGLSMFKILVCGGRAYANKKKVMETLDYYDRAFSVTDVVHGGAEGTDALASAWADANEKVNHKYPAKWKTWEKCGLPNMKSAGPIRNEQMLQANPDINVVIAFPGKNGTNDMVERARARGIDVRVIND